MLYFEPLGSRSNINRPLENNHGGTEDTESGVGRNKRHVRWQSLVTAYCRAVPARIASRLGPLDPSHSCVMEKPHSIALLYGKRFCDVLDFIHDQVLRERMGKITYFPLPLRVGANRCSVVGSKHRKQNDAASGVPDCSRGTFYGTAFLVPFIGGLLGRRTKRTAK